MYEIILFKIALQDIETLVKSGNRSVIRKVYRLLEELKVNPFHHCLPSKPIPYSLSG